MVSLHRMHKECVSIKEERIQKMAHKYIYLFTEGNANMRELLGGKGANLAEMTNIGLPVPPLTLVPVTHIPPPAHHPTELPPCKGMKRDAAPHTKQPPSLVTLATHTHIDTSTHRVTTEGGHWHRRAICLQGMEALEPPRHHHRAIRMQAATPMSDRVVTSHTHTHPDITTPTHRVTTLQGVEALERGRVQPPSITHWLQWPP